MKINLSLISIITFCGLLILSSTANTKTLKTPATPDVGCYITECRPAYKDALEAADIKYEYCTNLAATEYNVCKILANGDEGDIRTCQLANESAITDCDEVLYTADSFADSWFEVCKINCSDD